MPPLRRSERTRRCSVASLSLSRAISGQRMLNLVRRILLFALLGNMSARTCSVRGRLPVLAMISAAYLAAE